MLENFAVALCVWDIPAAIAFAGVAFVLFNQQRNHRKRMKKAVQLIRRRDRNSLNSD